MTALRQIGRDLDNMTRAALRADVVKNIKIAEYGNGKTVRKHFKYSTDFGNNQIFLFLLNWQILRKNLIKMIILYFVISNLESTRVKV